MPTRSGSIRLFRAFGIDVYLHLTWFLAAAYFIYYARGHSPLIWNALECLALFAIVLTHEFGHQLACRSVGGQTHDIILWPFGGVAYVSPPQRPGAQLWSIAAGPLVNVMLVPFLSLLVAISSHLGWYDTYPDAYIFIHNLWWINAILLIFNMLPIYPLDGGQILRSLLWFLFGRANSLMAASVIGFIGVIGLIGWAVLTLNPILGGGCVLIVLCCWSGLTQARALARLAKMPRRDGFACPVCKTAPPLGPVWRCGRCRQPFDTFATLGTCPHCGTQFAVTQCLDCGSARPITEWMTSPQPPPIIDV